MMIGYRINPWLRICWTVFTPALCGVRLIAFLCETFIAQKIRKCQKMDLIMFKYRFKNASLTYFFLLFPSGSQFTDNVVQTLRLTKYFYFFTRVFSYPCGQFSNLLHTTGYMNTPPGLKDWGCVLPSHPCSVFLYTLGSCLSSHPVLSKR